MPLPTALTILLEAIRKLKNMTVIFNGDHFISVSLKYKYYTKNGQRTFLNIDFQRSISMAFEPSQ